MSEEAVVGQIHAPKGWNWEARAKAAEEELAKVRDILGRIMMGDDSARDEAVRYFGTIPPPPEQKPVFTKG
jgi:hypothetical protein